MAHDSRVLRPDTARTVERRSLFRDAGRQLRRVRRSLTPTGPAAASIPVVEYLKYHVLTRLTPSFPQIIQVQTQYGCNARCTFCPMGREDNQIRGRMDDATYAHVVDQAVTGGAKVFSPYLQNDPLVDREIDQRIAYVIERRGRRAFPKTKLITNGALLTEERAHTLIRSGLDYLVFSVHGIDATVYDPVMQGPSFETTLRNVETFVRVKRELGARRPGVEVWAVRTQEVEAQLPEARRFWKDRNIKFKARELDNRAHPEITNNTDLAVEDVTWRFADHCTIPFWRAWILWNGDVVLCCVDWERRHIFGNIKETPLRDIWNGPEFRAYRTRMRNGDLSGTLCENCQGT